MSDITVIMSTSPVPSNPSTEIIENTLATVRYHLPEVPIIIMADGMRQEQWEYSDQRQNYQQFKENLLKVVDPNTRVIIFPKHLHQAGMTAKTLDEINTELLLFMEHDTPLVRLPIDWKRIEACIKSGYVNSIRLHPLTRREPLHEYLMRGDIEWNGLPLIHTVQWSQRPHVASVGFYRNLMKMFRQGSSTFIEDFLYDYITGSDWKDFKTAIYNPKKGGIQRSEHTDARGGAPKYEMRF